MLFSMAFIVLQSARPGVPATPAKPPVSGTALIESMRLRATARSRPGAPAAGLVLVKDADFTDKRSQRWYEVVHFPGLRRMDIAPLDSLNGLLFRRDSLYDIVRGAVAKTRPFVHVQSLLMYDVYAKPAAGTAAQLAERGFDLRHVRLTTWQDRPTYVVGAADGDRNSNQFWIDQDHLYLVRLIEQRGGEPGKPPRIQEVWFSGHRDVGGRWVPADVTYFVNGRQFLHERLHARPMRSVDSTDFLPERWTAAHRLYPPK